jgi:putative nucleotidyltransferase with HDIG domain
MANLDQFIERAKYLPPAPKLLPEMLSLLGQPDIDGERIVRLINYDPGLTANVLRLCNSAFLASAMPVVSLDEAVSRIGFNEIYRLVAASVSAAVLWAPGTGQNPIHDRLWAHSVVAAVAAQVVARDLDGDQNLAFTTALLHDIGKLILMDVLEEKYLRVFDEVEANSCSMIEMEARVVGVQHAELGGRLLARWKFPLSAVSGVCFHHDPGAAGTQAASAAYVYAGNLIAYLLGHGCGDSGFAQQGHETALKALGLRRTELNRYTEEIQAGFEHVKTLIQLRKAPPA